MLYFADAHASPDVLYFTIFCVNLRADLLYSTSQRKNPTCIYTAVFHEVPHRAGAGPFLVLCAVAQVSLQLWMRRALLVGCGASGAVLVTPRSPCGSLPNLRWPGQCVPRCVVARADGGATTPRKGSLRRFCWRLVVEQAHLGLARVEGRGAAEEVLLALRRFPHTRLL